MSLLYTALKDDGTFNVFFRISDVVLLSPISENKQKPAFPITVNVYLRGITLPIAIDYSTREQAIEFCKMIHQAMLEEKPCS